MSVDVSDADSDDIAGLLGDVDTLDDGLFGGSNKPAAKSSPKSSIEKKVSFATDPKPKNDSLFDPSSLKSKPPEEVSSTPKSDTASTMSRDKNPLDDLFGPTTRRPAAAATTPSVPAQKQAAKPGSWLGLGKDDSDEEDGGFGAALAKKRQSQLAPATTSSFDTPPATQKKPAASSDDPFELSRPAKTTQPSKGLSFLDEKPYEPPRAKPPEPSSPQQQRRMETAPAAVEMQRQPQAQYQSVAPTTTTQQQVNPQLTQHYQDVIDRLKKDNERLLAEISEIREKHKDELERTAREYKDRIEAQKVDNEEDIVRIKEQHKRALEELQEDRQFSIERVKQSMTQEIEAATSAYQHTKSYHEVVSKVESAVERLSSLSGDVTNLSQKSNDQRETTLGVREQRVQHLEKRLESELESVTAEKEKLHGILSKLETTAKEQEKLLEYDKLHLREERSRFEAERSAFVEKQKHYETNYEKVTQQLSTSKETFLTEQQELLKKVLQEEERLNQERYAFQVQRDRDVVKLRTEATRLDELRKQLEKLENDCTFAKSAAEERSKRCIELESVLEEEQRKIERVAESLRRDADQILQTQSELQFATSELKQREQEVIQSQKFQRDHLSGVDLREREYLEMQAAQMAEQRRDLIEDRKKLNTDRQRLRSRGDEVATCPQCGARVRFERPTSSSDIAFQHQAAEKPYDSPELEHSTTAMDNGQGPSSFSRQGSIRTVLINHAKNLERFVAAQEAFADDL